MTRMGRPSLNVKPTLVRLPENMGDRIDALVGKNRRAEFIREAVLKAVEREERRVVRDCSDKDRTA